MAHPRSGASSTERASAWRVWLHQPRKTWLRRAFFQVHLWSGVGLGLYVFFISVTGSVLVYRNELYVAATPAPVFSTSVEPLLDDPALTAAAERAHAGHRVRRLVRSSHPDQAVEIWLARDGEVERRLFDPRTGADLGSAEALGIEAVSTLIELHDDLLGGRAGRKVNGVGAVAVLLVAVTGLVIWWRGVGRWRRALTLRRSVGWKRFFWDLHNAIGFWSFAFVVVFCASGVYLCFPDAFHAWADRLDPPTEANAGQRLVDRVLYWLAFLHFGRINGIGLPCSGPGLCDQAVKATWAIVGLAPAVMFVTGATMWWNRVLRRWWSSGAAR
jgi:uncharacterized iron-regulated membrane protein